MTEPESRTLSAKKASAEELIRSLPEAGPAYLMDALENPEIGEEHVVLILRNRAATEPVLRKIAGNPRWVRAYDVKAGLVMHRRTPHHTALNLAKFLFWRDLARVADDWFLFPPLRRLAEKVLSDRIPEMAVGEKIAFARIAGRGLIPRLLDERDTPVLEALLWNGRLTEQDVSRKAGDAATPPETLAAIAQHPRWSGCYGVRVALARNPRAPLPLSLGFLTRMTVSDLVALADNPETPQALKLACERVLSDEAWRRRHDEEF